MTFTSPDSSITATTEFVVPRSMPMIFSLAIVGVPFFPLPRDRVYCHPNRPPRNGRIGRRIESISRNYEPISKSDATPVRGRNTLILRDLRHRSRVAFQFV